MIKKAWIYFFLLSRKKQISLVVWTFHFFLLTALIINHLWTRSTPKTRPIAVRTFASVSQTETPLVSTKTANIQTSPKPLAPKTSAKKPAPNKKAAPKADENESALQSVANALEELKSLEKKKEPLKTLSVPSQIRLETKGAESKIAQTYGAFLVAYLENSLDLPEYGNVKLELSIDRTGRLLTSQVLSSESDKNSEFLKNRLPELAFPCFNDFQIAENTLTFTVSFRNAETF